MARTMWMHASISACMAIYLKTEIHYCKNDSPKSFWKYRKIWGWSLISSFSMVTHWAYFLIWKWEKTDYFLANVKEDCESHISQMFENFVMQIVLPLPSYQQLNLGQDWWTGMFANQIEIQLGWGPAEVCQSFLS